MNSKKYTDEIIKNIPLGIVISDASGIVKNANDKFLDMVGYKRDDLYGKSIGVILRGFIDLKKLLSQQNELQSREVYINAKTNKVRFTLSMYHIGKDKMEKDIIYLFSDEKKPRKLSNKIGDNKAIYTFDKIIHTSHIFQRTIKFAKKISDSKSTVLITGETGTGKEIFAQSIHNYSRRRDMPFIAINAAAIPPSLIESELFGYEGGAFTGAKREGQVGKFEIAHKGTIFLDEIGEMPLELQTRLLRVLEEGIVSRVGSIEQTYVDVRIIAASNKDLKAEVRSGNFRQDLFYRLNVLPLYLSPLRKRKEDIEPLVDYFMDRISKRLNKKKVEIRKEEMQALINYKWPGNVRELENLVELTINLEHFPEELVNYYNQEEDHELPIDEEMKNTIEDFSLEEIERIHIKHILEKNDGNITTTARELGIARNTLYRKMEMFGLK